MNKFSKWFKKHFIPHEGNNHNPHFLRSDSVMFFLLIIIVAQLGFLVQVFVVFDKTKFLAAVLPAILTEETNQERADANLPPLTENELLTKAAQMKAEDMATRGYFAHTSPDGKTPWYWLGQVGYSYQSAGENLAVNFFESSDVSNAWMNSPTHKANIVKPNYKEIGIGVANGVYEGRETVFVAQFFGTPLVFASTPPPEETPKVQTQPTKTVTPAPKTPVKPKPIPPKVTPTPTTTPSTKVAVEPAGTPLNIVAIAPTETIVLGEQTTKASKTSFMRSALEKLLTSPIHLLNYIYGAVIMLFAFAILMFLFIKSEFKHPKVLGKSMALVGVIVILLILDIKVLHVKTLVPEGNLSANAIEAIAN